MGKPTGFLEYNRELPKTKAPKDRIINYKEFYLGFSNKKTERQAARCMDCGTPFCHSACPLGNNIPEFNDMVYQENWKKAYEILSTTNNFPEFTGRVCPAPCEASCVLGIIKPQITIEHIEKAIIEKAFNQGWLTPQTPQYRTGKKVAIIGSGPTGLAAASQLNKAGHNVTVYEKDDRLGGLLRYGIPDFKLEKHIIDRRIELMENEGIIFKTNSYVGENVKIEELLNLYDAILLSGGTSVARDLNIKGRSTKGVHFALEFLIPQNKRNAGDKIDISEDIDATGKDVFVIGGGDTGSDCVGTSIRQNAKSVTMIELLPKPSLERNENNPWPEWPNILRTSSSHNEGGKRLWSVLTKEFISNKKGELQALKIVDIKWSKNNKNKWKYTEIESSIREVKCDIALISIGFAHAKHEGMINQLGVEIENNGNIKSNCYQTNKDKIFVAGDMRIGQSLIVRAISEGREVAKSIDIYLMRESTLESKNTSIFEV